MELLQQVLRYSTQHSGQDDTPKTSYSSTTGDLAWLSSALAAVGKEESEKLGKGFVGVLLMEVLNLI
jgi:hypothetical protein